MCTTEGPTRSAAPTTACEYASRSARSSLDALGSATVTGSRTVSAGSLCVSVSYSSNPIGLVTISVLLDFRVVYRGSVGARRGGGKSACACHMTSVETSGDTQGNPLGRQIGSATQSTQGSKI